MTFKYILGVFIIIYSELVCCVTIREHKKTVGLPHMSWSANVMNGMKLE